MTGGIWMVHELLEMTENENKPMTKEAMAALLTGREYGEEMTEAEESLAQLSDLVVVFGYSDDNTEFRGVINEEVGGCGTHELYVNKEGVLQSHDSNDCECHFCGYEDAKKKARKIKAIWGTESDDYSWTFETEIPHATFDILENGIEKYCRGIVFSAKDL